MTQKPEEWVLVPREPTPEMVGAFWRVKNGHHFHDEPPPTDRSDYAAYRAMIAASPSPEGTRERGEVDARYAALGRAAEANGLAWYIGDGTMRFQAPADVIAECAVEAYVKSLTLPPVPGVDRGGSSCTETAARGTTPSLPDTSCKSEGE